MKKTLWASLFLIGLLFFALAFWQRASQSRSKSYHAELSQNHARLADQLVVAKHFFSDFPEPVSEMYYEIFWFDDGEISPGALDKDYSLIVRADAETVKAWQEKMDQTWQDLPSISLEGLRPIKNFDPATCTHFKKKEYDEDYTIITAVCEQGSLVLQRVCTLSWAQHAGEPQKFYCQESSLKNKYYNQ